MEGMEVLDMLETLDVITQDNDVYENDPFAEIVVSVSGGESDGESIEQKPQPEKKKRGRKAGSTNTPKEPEEVLIISPDFVVLATDLIIPGLLSRITKRTAESFKATDEEKEVMKETAKAVAKTLSDYVKTKEGAFLVTIFVIYGAKFMEREEKKYED